MLNDATSKYILESIDCLKSLIKASGHISAVVDILQSAKDSGMFVFIIGNGGSASTASHMACDLNKKTGVKALSLTDNVSLVTAWSNDTCYDMMFERQLERFAKAGDVVIGISCSGNSENIVWAMRKASDLGCHTIGLTGFDGGILKGVVDECIVVDSYDMLHIEDIHLLLGHMITFLLGERYGN